MACPSFIFASLLLFTFGPVDLGVLAQNGRFDGPPATPVDTDLFVQFLNTLDGLGFTNFTAVARQVNADPGQLAFPLAVTDSRKSQTLFVPNNDAFANPETNFDGYTYNSTDTQFLSALLLYHLLPGTPLLEALAVGGVYIAPTALQGHNVTQLENDEPQVIAFAAGTNGTIEVYNQVQTTTVLNSYAYLNLSIYEVNEIIGFPGSYSYLIESYGLSDLDAMRSAGGASSLDGAQGYTLFAPLNSGFDAAKATLSSLSPADVWNNHVIMGQTLYSPNFTAETHTSGSGFNYSFDISSDLGGRVTLNGVTANILRSDVLTDNGVVHVVDQVFWNTSPAALVAGDANVSASSTAALESSSATISAASTSSGTSTASRSAVAVSGAVNGTTLSPGAIIGIVALVLIVLSVPLVLILTRRYRRRAAQGVRVRHDRRRSAFEPPAPVPFKTWYDTPSGKESGPHESQVSPSSPREKNPFALRDLENNIYGVAPSPVSGASGVPMPGVIPMLTPEVVDHIVHQVSQRIDRAQPSFPPGIPSGSGPPPAYPPSYHSRAPIHIRSHLRRTMG
ncbi:hypothetical protein PHLGIDRAFT_327588 [Phlebiopsis gigantea 11061_1 CR5-6]|uniref:FAS1 domain-containing protein n=1 Tax=Phlebiopsis gigantea (strain 11061_1 CR5-6) TaxID=745531 RepID=A0A0C3SFK4_PHLG1|nr:hypothetical protein PHLGIDRAFT_327588 [Phlebiopsis gigantea 11061_1 CR5-6]